MASDRGRLYVGTSGFSYPGWVPRFYAPGPASRKLLVAYSARLSAVELHNTFYRRPLPEQVAKWLRETPTSFRFCPKAQRGTAWRVWTTEDPGPSFAWLEASFAGFGERLGCVLLSARGSMERDERALARVLAAWPATMRLALELPHPSWDHEGVRRQVRDAGAALVATDWEGRDEPDVRADGPLVYVRLRRSRYEPADVDRWAGRLERALASGSEVYAFFRHDDDGAMALQAEVLQQRLGGFTAP